jgi:hypothetical protein
VLVYAQIGELAFFVCTRDISICMRDEKTKFEEMKYVCAICTPGFTICFEQANVYTAVSVLKCGRILMNAANLVLSFNVPITFSQ